MTRIRSTTVIFSGSGRLLFDLWKWMYQREAKMVDKGLRPRETSQTKHVNVGEADADLPTLPA